MVRTWRARVGGHARGRQARGSKLHARWWRGRPGWQAQQAWVASSRWHAMWARREGEAAEVRGTCGHLAAREMNRLQVLTACARWLC
jgi:hypothetical protein